MAFRVFLAHKASLGDSPLVTAIQDVLKEIDVECFVAENYREPGKLITEKVEEAILSCNVVIALWTEAGAASAFVNQEIGFARGRRKPVIPFVEAGVKLKGVLYGMDVIEFSKDAVEKAAESLVDFVDGLKLEESQKQIVMAICLVALGALVLFLLVMAVRE